MLPQLLPADATTSAALLLLTLTLLPQLVRPKAARSSASFLLALTLLLLPQLVLADATTSSVHLGLCGPWSDGGIVTVAPFAAKVALQAGLFEDVLLNETELPVHIHPVDTACSSSGIGEKIIPLLFGQGTQEGRIHSDTLDIPPVLGIIGCGCSAPSLAASQLVTPFKVPLLSPGATDISLSDKTTHPYFTRVVPTETQQSAALAALANYLGDPSLGGWSRLTILYVSRASSSNLADAFCAQAAVSDMTLVKESIPDVGVWQNVSESAYQLFKEALLQIAKTQPFPRIFVMPATREDIFLFAMMLEVGIFTSESAILTSDDFLLSCQSELEDLAARQEVYQQSNGTTSVADEEAIFFQSSAGNRDWSSVLASLHGLIGVRTKLEGPLLTSERFRSFWTSLTPERIYEAGYPSDATIDGSLFEVDTIAQNESAMLSFDASLAMLMAMTSLVSGGTDVASLSGQDLLGSISSVNFTGLTGRVALDANGDRLASYEIDNIVGDALIAIGDYDTITGLLTLDTPPIFPSNSTVVPADRPVNCSAGSGANGNECEACDPGRFSPFEGSSCMACPSGTYASENQSTACASAEPGTYVAYEGSSEALFCPPGQASQILGAAFCVDCQPGFFTNDTGSTACHWCLEGFFSEDPGARACTACNSSQTTASVGSSSSSECICPAGTYRPHVSSAATTDCLPCPSAMLCELGSDMAQLAMEGGLYPKVAAGYMTRLAEPLQAYKCVEEGHCPGGPPGSCAENRDGEEIACGVCEDSYYPDPSGEGCKPCTGGIDGALFIVVVIGLLLVLAVSLLLISKDTLQQTHAPVFSALCVGMIFTGLQTLGIFHHLAVEWTQPIKAAAEVAALFSFDLTLLRTNCVLGTDPGAHFAFRLLVFPLVVVPVIGFVTWLRRNQLPFRLQFQNNLGTCLGVCFISTVVSCGVPFVCYSHPGDGLWSMTSIPSILCFQGTSFGAMAVFGGAIFSFIPLPYLCLSIQAVWMYPVLLRRQDSFETLQGLRFLFVRFRPEGYYYAPVILTRNLALGLVPMLFPQAAAQVLLLCGILLLFLVPQAQLWPWRSYFVNVADILITGLLLILLVSGGMLAEIDRSDNVILILNVVVVAAFASILGATSVYIWQKFVAGKVPYYSKFICLHKAAAAAQARLLKMNIANGSASVFIGADDILSLDVLFDIVKTKVHTMIVYLTRETLKRPWCAGEIATAFHASQARVVVIRLPSFANPTKEELQDLSKYVDGSGRSLKQFGISWDVVRTSYLKLLDDRQTPCINVVNTPYSSLQFEQVAGAANKGRSCKLFKKLPSARDPTPTNLNQVIVSADVHDDEATAAAAICVRKIQERLFHKENRSVAVCSLVERDEEDQAGLHACIAHSRAAVVLLSQCSLENRAQLFLLLTAQRLRASVAHLRSPRDFSPEACITIVPVLLPGFVFPTDRYYNLMLPLYVTEELEESRNLIKDVFDFVAVSFPTHGTDSALDGQVDKVMDRIYTGARLPEPKGKSTATDEEQIAPTNDANGTVQAEETPKDEPPGATDLEMAEPFLDDGGGILDMAEPFMDEGGGILSSFDALDIVCEGYEGCHVEL